MDDKAFEGMRLHVYLARCGIASRRKCETYIAEQRVTVNGKPVTVPGTRYREGDTVCFDGVEVTPSETSYYVMLHKPPGYLCSSSDPDNRPLAIDLLGDRYSARLFNVGRLDLYSSGLLLFTNDGEFTRIITHPSSEIEKEYIIETREPLRREDLSRFKDGVSIEKIHYKIRSFRPLDAHVASITLIEGKNREIRTVFSYFEYTLRKLHRVRIGDISLGMLKPGEFRELETWEIKTVLQHR